MLPCGLENFAAQKNRLDFFHYGWHYAYSISAAWDASMQLEYFCNAKCQCGIHSTLAFLASHEARCRMAVFSIQLTKNPHQTGEPRGPSPSGGKTPAKPHIPLRPCAPKARSSKGAKPPSREACRRAAVERSQAAFLRALCAHSAQSGVKGYYPLREARRRAAVKPRPNRISSTPLRAHGAQSGGAGGHPLLYGEGFVLAEEGGVFGEKGTDEGGKELVHLLGTAARVESRIK